MERKLSEAILVFSGLGLAFTKIMLAERELRRIKHANSPYGVVR